MGTGKKIILISKINIHLNELINPKYQATNSKEITTQMKKIIVLLLIVVSANIYSQKFKNLALTPPMGWNSWNKFACNINEKIIRDVADAMVSSGMKDCGYQYIIIDDC